MLGISTFCLHELPLPAALDILGEHTDAVEIMDDGNHYLESAEPLQSHEFRYFLHSPSRGVNIASLREPIRRASVEVLTESFSVAAEVDAPVVIHPGYFAWKGEREPALLQFRRSLQELKTAAADLSVTFFVENMPAWDYFLLRFPEEIPLLDGQGLALDVGHARLNGCLPSFLDLPLAHAHLHDNDGKSDSHDTIGKGTIDFRPVIRAVERDHTPAIVEVATLAGVLESMKVLDRV
ncbi:MAG TPA: sugar phosphate isomerase/epimerase family protein [Methanomicrobiales archaeon]|nr:sugar phosphate isomerase/epimerase family protein [Methanomicrobiales archaeon]